MSATDTQDATVLTPPTMSPVTAANFIETHRGTLPNRIDKSMMMNLAGGDRNRLLNALRFLGLTEPPGDTPSARFVRFRDAADETALAAAWADVALTAYRDAIDGLDLASATQAQIDERFRETYKITGDTIRKSVAFFLSLARLGNVPLSTYVKKTRPRGAASGPARPRAPRPPKSQRAAGSNAGGSGTTPLEKPAGSSAMVVRFKSGGSATLYVSVDLIALSTEDRNALISWIDAMKKYATENPAPAQSNEAQAAT